MTGKELLKLSKIIPRETLVRLPIENIIKDHLRRHFSQRRIFNKNAEAFVQFHVLKRRTAEKIVEKIKELIFSDFEENIKEILTDFEAIAPRLSPDFDVVKMANDFLENPPEEAEDEIEKEADGDWEFFREISAREKERRNMMKEKMTETIFYYAEKYEEVRSLTKNI